MTTQGKIHLDEFLNYGAIYRDKDGKSYIWQGKESNVPKNRASIHFMNFFDSNMQSQSFKEGPIKISVGELRAQLCEKQKETLPLSDFVQPAFEDFHISYTEILSRIHRGELEKAVPVVAATSDHALKLEQMICLLDQILEAPNSLHVYGFWNEDGGVLGASPEILFERNETSIKTMALAGTCPRAEVDNRIPLLKDPKEMYEHKLVIDDIWQRLSTLGNVTVSKTEVVELPTLLHLMTSLEVLSSKSDLDLFKLLHPTPALGIYPRNYGISWMSQLPFQKERKIFGAPILFPLSPDRSICIVAIRNIQWSAQGKWVGAGCGLVRASQLEQEWNELQSKLKSIFSLFGVR